MRSYLRRLVLGATSCVLVFLAAPSVDKSLTAYALPTALEISDRITQLTGLQPSEIDEIYAAEQAADVILIQYEVLIPIVREARIAYLLVRQASTGQWIRVIIDSAEWNTDFRPYLESRGVQIHRQPYGTIDALPPDQEAADIASTAGNLGAANAITIFGSGSSSGGGGGSPPVGTNVGFTDGRFSVSPVGSANYSIPIAVPPGVAGVVPGISLEYNSRSGNGLLGVGWSISGISVITRCATTVAQDGLADGVDLESDDAFCLDGQRLIAVGGAEYRTEIETFQKITASGTAGNGPASFTVRDKAGFNREYGTSAATRILADGSSNAIAYALRRVTDRYGNYVDYSYETSGEKSTYRPSLIAYGNASGTEVGRVTFTYEDRTDTSSGYIAGSEFLRTKRLKAITTFAKVGGNAAATTPVREYSLSYEFGSVTNHSQVSQVIECIPGTSDCFYPTKVRWQQGSRGFTDSVATSIAESGLTELRVVDLNNNGISDYLYVNGNQWRVRYDSIDAPEVNTGHTAHYWDQDFAQILDFNGDGYRDIVQRAPGNVVELLVGTGSGFTKTVPTLPYTALTDAPSYTIAIDADVDGFDDIVRLTYVPSPGPFDPNFGQASVSIAIHHGSANDLGSSVSTGNLNDPPTNGLYLDQLTPLDYEPSTGSPTDSFFAAIQFDNDRRPDFLLNLNSQLRVVSFNGSSFTKKTAHSSPPTDWKHVKYLDANGDGLTDQLFHSATEWKLWVSTGTTFVEQWSASSVAYQAFIDLSGTEFNTGLPVPEDWQNGGEQTLSILLTDSTLSDAKVIDYNRDGRQDVLINHLGIWKALLGDGAGYGSAIADSARPASLNHARAVIVDTGGDGLPDILYPDGTWRIYHQRGPVSELVAEIENGLGAKTQISYAPITEGGLYTGPTPMAHSGAQPVFPYRHFGAPLIVVKEFATDNGVGTDGAVYTSYEYGGAKWHAQGRGFLGFSSMRAWNSNREIETKTQLRQDFPFVGSTLEATQYMPMDAASSGPLSDYSIDSLDLVQEFRSECEYSPLSCEFLFPPNVTTTVATSPKPVSKTTNTFGSISSFSGKVHLPYQATSTALSYPLIGGTTAPPLKRVVTEYNNLDSYGNTRQTLVTVDDGAGGDVHTVTTNATYINDEANWCIGLVDQLSVTQARALYSEGYLDPGSSSITNTTDFDYNASTCALATNVIEPNGGSPTDRTLTTVHTYDTFGNADSQTVSSPGLTQSRTSSLLFGYDGRFPTEVRNALNHVSASTWDERFGRKLSETGLSQDVANATNIVTTWTYDDFGLLATETAPASAFVTTVARTWCSVSTPCSSSRAVYRVTTTATDGSWVEQEYDRLNREVHSRTKKLGGGYVSAESHFDALGREYLVSAPYVDGDPVCYTFRQFDALDRPIAEAAPNTGGECDSVVQPHDAALASLAQSSVTTYQYDQVSSDGIETVSTGPGVTPRTVTTVRNVMDRVRAVYEHDATRPAGDQLIETRYDFDAAGRIAWTNNAEGNVSTVEFDILGFKIAQDDPNMGSWTYKYNPVGDLIYQRDAKGNEVTIEYDAIGRPERRVEDYPAGNPSHADAMVTDWTYDDAPGDSVGQLATEVGPYRQGSGPASSDYESNYAYDNLGRLADTIKRLEGDYFWTSLDYDALGRVQDLTYPSIDGGATATTTGADRFKIRNSYDADGFHVKVSNQSGTLDYWNATDSDAWGNITRTTLGNGLTTVRGHSLATGFLTSVSTGSSGSVQSLAYSWDRYGNLERRTDYQAGRYETFTYDALHRLKESKLYRSSDDQLLDSGNTSYDKVGNILQKDSDFTGYQYGDPNHANAVTQVTAGGVVRNYSYDLNGNLETGGGRTISWTSFNKPIQILNSGTGYASTFFYGADRMRYKQVAVRPKASSGSASITETTLYASPIFEQVDRDPSDGPAESTEFRHYIVAGGAPVAVLSKRASGSEQTEYLHTDHLGSVVAMTDETGSVLSRASYDAWGKRRNESTWQAFAPGSLDQQFDFGTSLTVDFTGHESLAHVGLVHMNGRIYDPEIGRFISADPFVQFTYGTQSLNRYTYVSNNPLSFADPSGYFLERVWGVIRAVIPRPLRPFADFVAGTIATGNPVGGLIWMSAGLIADETGYGFGESLNPGYAAPTGPPIIVNFDSGEQGPDDSWDLIRDGIQSYLRELIGIVHGNQQNTPSDEQDGGTGIRVVALGHYGYYIEFDDPELQKAYYEQQVQAFVPDFACILNGDGCSGVGRTLETLGLAGYVFGAVQVLRTAGGITRVLRQADEVPNRVQPGRSLGDRLLGQRGAIGASPPRLKRIHSDRTITTGSNRFSYDHWSNQSTDDIVRSLTPGADEALRIKPDGRIINGNTRIKVLEERGYDINSLPREVFE